MKLRQSIRFCAAKDGARLAYATSGRGPSLVKACNYLSHLEFDLRSPVWQPLFETLSERFSLVRSDQRGTGLSDREIADISFDAWVDDLEAVVDAAAPERFALLGISQGASIAVSYATRHPERVTHLVLHGGFSRGRRKRGDPALEDLAETMVRLAEQGWGQNDEAFRQFFTSQFIPGGTPEQHNWFNELERVSTTPATAARIMRAFDEVDITPLLSKVSCPTLVLHAIGDRRVPFAEGRRLAGAIPHARFVPLHSENHLILEQDPEWPRWVDEITEFLGGVSRKPAGEAFGTLTPRERQLVELIAQGRDNSQIGATLNLTDKTVSQPHHEHILEARGREPVASHRDGAKCWLRRKLNEPSLAWGPCPKRERSFTLLWDPGLMRLNLTSQMILLRRFVAQRQEDRNANEPFHHHRHHSAGAAGPFPRPPLRGFKPPVDRCASSHRPSQLV